MSDSFLRAACAVRPGSAVYAQHAEAGGAVCLSLEYILANGPAHAEIA